MALGMIETRGLVASIEAADAMAKAASVTIVGQVKAGKTTLVTSLVRMFTDKGLTVSTVKHAHSGYTIDTPGTDTHRHRTAGAHETAIVADDRWALMHEAGTGGASPTLETMLAKLGRCDKKKDGPTSC